MFISEDDIQSGLDYLRENADVAAKARAERIHMEDYTKSLLATLMSEHPLLAVNAQEREAWRDPRMLKHLQAKKIAIFEDERHRFRLRAVEARLDAWRTQSATERAMKI